MIRRTVGAEVRHDADARTVSFSIMGDYFCGTVERGLAMSGHARE